MATHRVGGRSRVGFTLVELLVVIAIIGMLAALLMPAINSAREAARQAQCTNNQHQFGEAILQYVTSKEYFPGYRDLLPSQSTANKYYIISWQVALLPNVGKTDVYQALQNDSIGIAGTPMPYLEGSVCPSDFSGVGRTSPWTSYVANTGYLDTQALPGDIKANGVLQDRARYNTANPKAKVSLTDIRDGQSTTLMFSENVDACYYVDQPVLFFATAANVAPAPADVDAKVVSPNGNTSERGAGFLWWDTSPSATINPPPPTAAQLPGLTLNSPEQGINGKKGSYDLSTDTTLWPNPNQDFYNVSKVNNYPARPASNHPGGVIVTFVGGNTRFLREDIDYPVYCLLMTSDGANCTNDGHITTKSHDGTNHSWQKYKTLDEGSL